MYTGTDVQPHRHDEPITVAGAVAPSTGLRDDRQRLTGEPTLLVSEPCTSCKPNPGLPKRDRRRSDGEPNDTLLKESPLNSEG